jgi:hypothetical protein
MDGNIPPHMNLQMLFGIAEATGDFTQQESFFYTA